MATTLTTPASGSRFTGYFRTTFEVPDDGNVYVIPTLRYILDDGGFVYLDGELVLRVNVGAADDGYLVLAGGTANTESHIRTADLSLPAGSSTGGNTEVSPAIGGNATVVQSVGSLAPGTHTLAVSIHNANSTSSDLALAVQLTAVQTDCLINVSTATVTRNFSLTPNNSADDTIRADLTVVPTGVTSASWIVSGPAGSAAVGQGGTYNSAVGVTGIPIAEFGGGPLVLTLADSANADCTTTVSIQPQRIIATNNLFGTNLPVATTGTNPDPGWVFDDAARTLVLNNPGGGTTRKVVRSVPVNLSGQPDVQFSGVLQIDDTSAGNEPDDSFVAYLVLNGNTENRINLISRHDTITPDGVLTGSELAPGNGVFLFALDHVIPASATSVQIVIEGINNSVSEVFTVRDLAISPAPPGIQAYAGPIVFDNQGTPNPADDMFSAPITITPVNIGASTGWTATNGTPTSGLYSAPQPVIFGPFAPFTSPRTITFRDGADPTRMTSVTLTLALPTLAVTGPTNLVRVENGPGFDDDTVTFDLTITGATGGPHWSTNTPGVTPDSGPFGTTTFTLNAPLEPGPFPITIFDVSYPTVNQTVNIQVPGRYIFGQSDLSGTLTGVSTSLSIVPAPQWASDPTDRTITLTNAGAGTGGAPPPLRVVESESLDLTALNEVYFSARLRAVETSTSTNFETVDRFKAELIYEVAGTPTTINLIAPFDTGNGAPSTTGTTGGIDGPPNGFLNGYQGAAGTDLATGAVYANGTEDYDANRSRDEFNRLLQSAAASLDNTLNLAATIPADADSVRLVVTGQGVSTSETFIVSNVLFSLDSTLADSDMDGIPDAYEIANGLNPNDAGDRDLDLDGDGQSNYAEFLAGTAANSAASVFRMAPATVSANTAHVTWNSVPTKSYRIDFSTDLSTWTDLGTNFPAAAAPAAQTSSGPLDLGEIGNPDEAYLRVRVAN
ncbi:hypothetical protein BH23VER1_BH23VER1_10910 [soil metagenome]